MLGLLAVLVTLASAVVFALAVSVVIISRTTDSRMIAITTALFSVIAVLVGFRILNKRQVNWRIVTACSVAYVAVVVFCLMRVPNGLGSQASPLQSVYVRGRPAPRISPAMFVPESDQIRIGSYLLPAVDSKIDLKKAARFRDVFDGLYAEIHKSEEFQGVGSVLNDAYKDMLWGRRDTSHYYAYYPNAEGKRPAIIFFHGWLGNLKGYVWLWSRFARKNDFVVVCPSFGGGFWNRDAGLDTLEETLARCSADPRIDASRIYVAGLSNGAFAVTRVALHFPRSVRGLIYISPVLEETAAGEEFRTNAASIPILVIHGTDDRRLPLDIIDQRVKNMRTVGLQVEARYYEGEDHILFFSAFDRLQRDLESWLFNPETTIES